MTLAPKPPPGLAKLPPFPPVAARLLNMLSNATVNVAKAAELIRSDATFTAALLHRVNSIEFGLRYPIANAQQAIVTLGLNRTRQVVVNHAAATYMRQGLHTSELRTCWQHMLATAVLADQIAAAADAFTNIAFTAGMMHDIGRLGLLVAYPKEYERIVRDAAERCLDLLDFEREEFGLDHAEAGRILAERWGLPEELRVVAGRHHDPCEGTELDLLRIVHVACHLADVLGYGMTKELIPKRVEEVLAELPDRVRQRLAVTPEQLCEQIEQRILDYDSDQVDAPPKVEAEFAEAAGEETAAEEARHAAERPAARSLRRSAAMLVLLALLIALAAFIWHVQA